jgi:hypothetical protein
MIPPLSARRPGFLRDERDDGADLAVWEAVVLLVKRQSRERRGSVEAEEAERLRDVDVLLADGFSPRWQRCLHLC